MAVIFAFMVIVGHRQNLYEQRGSGFMVAGFLVIANMLAAVAALVTASTAVYQVLLVLMLARPMAAFLLVLASFESTPGAGQG